MSLPKQYAWLAAESGPRILVEARKLYGTAEQPGPGNNPSILEWAKRVGLEKTYRTDATAWCGLFMAYVALQSGWDPPTNPLWARNWVGFGRRTSAPMLGDVLVFERAKGYGHVGLYVGEDVEAFHVLGGNQKDKVSIVRILKSRLIQVRRCRWRINQPANVRKIKLAADGVVSKNEG